MHFNQVGARRSPTMLTMHSAASSVVFCMLLAFATGQSAVRAPTVQLDEATVLGTTDGITTSFLGLPFAQPPCVSHSSLSSAGDQRISPYLLVVLESFVCNYHNLCRVTRDSSTRRRTETNAFNRRWLFRSSCPTCHLPLANFSHQWQRLPMCRRVRTVSAATFQGDEIPLEDYGGAHRSQPQRHCSYWNASKRTASCCGRM